MVVEQIADSGAVLEPKLRRFGLICLSLCPPHSHPDWTIHADAYSLNASQSSRAYWAKIMGPVNWAKFIENTFLTFLTSNFCCGQRYFFVKPGW